MKREEYENWVNKAFSYIKEVCPTVSQLKNVNVGSTQYIPKLDGDIEFVFLGHDAHEGISDDSQIVVSEETKERFFVGNGKPQDWRKDKKWKIWNNLESAFRNVKFDEIMDNGYISDNVLQKTIVTNAVFFNYTGKAEELNSLLKNDIVNNCMKLTGKLIFEVIKPKIVICSSCKLVFLPLINNYNKSIKIEKLHLPGTRKIVMRCKYNDTIILGIPHTSYPVPLSVASFIKNSYLNKEMDYSLCNVQKSKASYDNKKDYAYEVEKEFMNICSSFKQTSKCKYKYLFNDLIQFAVYHGAKNTGDINIVYIGKESDDKLKKKIENLKDYLINEHNFHKPTNGALGYKTFKDYVELSPKEKAQAIFEEMNSIADKIKSLKL